MRCCVPFCSNISINVSPSEGEGKEISFHGFPSEVHLRAAWLRALGKQDNLPDSAVVCSQHFLNDDIYETESGLRQIRTGAIPSTVQVCMICLDTDGKLLLMSKHKLEEAYEKLTGQALCDQRNLKQTLCVQCAQRLVYFSRFRDQSLRARALMMDLVEKHELITGQHIKLINRTKHQLKSNMVMPMQGPDHCDLHILVYPSEDKQKELEKIKLEGIMEIEENYESMFEEEVEMRNEDDNNVIDFVRDPLKYESASFQCTLCLEEFAHKHAYMQHMSMHLQQNDDSDGECKMSQVCKPHTAASSSSAYSSLITGNKQADPSTSIHAAMTLAVPLSASRAINIEMKEPLKERADTDDSGRYTTLTGCFVKLYDIFPKKVVPRRDGSLTKTQKQAGVSASKDVSYSAASQNEVLTTEHIEPVTHEEKDTVSKTVYICDICRKNLKQKSGLLKHIQNHTLAPRFTCNICQYKSNHKNNFTMHMRTHTGEKPYSCKLCKKRFISNSHLVLHVRTHTGVKPYVCNLCESKFVSSRKFFTKNDLVKHMRTHTGEKPYHCKLCEYKCAQYGVLVRHMRTHTGEKPYHCKLCEYKCAQSCQLVRHMRTHTGEKPYHCKFCKYKCNNNSGLVLHTRTHTGEKPYPCKLCESKFLSNSDLLRHMRTHTGEMRYHCKLCEYKCAKNRQLVLHMKTHTGEMPYHCKLCEYKCAKNGQLVLHMRTHTSEKPYYCKFCKYKCKTNSGLVLHMRTHTGEKPYPCKSCDSKFISKGNLVNHMRTHTGEKPYHCMICTYKCIQSCQLVKHMRTHTGEKPYHCKLCKHKCAQNSQLVKHMRTHTGKKLSE